VTSRDPGRPHPERGTPGGTEPPFDPTSWTGALVSMVVVAAALWIVQLVNDARGLSFNRFGLRPRHVDGLWGVIAAPVLHDSYGQLLSETVPVVAIGWVLLLSGVRSWLVVTFGVLVVGGLLTWLVGPDRTVLGTGVVVFGWLGYLLARAYFTRNARWIAAAVGLLFFFGVLLGGLLPSVDKHASWQAHVCGFVTGVALAAVLHPRTRRRRSRSA
jgi:membrane associated rhomboid family serine protease